MESACYLCDDLLRNILAQLPTKSLVRFKSVSKSWRSLIEDPYFSMRRRKKPIMFDKPLSRAKKKKNKLLMFDDYKPSAWFSSYLQSVSPGNFERFYLPEELDRVLMKPFSSTLEPLGSCRGLILLGYCYNPRLWMLNASTRECYSFNNIPEVRSLGIEDWKCASYGFGYDSVNDDYKVIRIFSSGNKGLQHTNQTSVYSLRNNSWRRIQNDLGLGHCTIRETPGVLVGRKLHWIADSPGGQVAPYILAFDISSEDFLEMALPPQEEDVKTTYGIFLTEVEGCLTVTEVRKKIPFSVAIWVLKKSGWVELLRTSCDHSFSFMAPLAYSKYGDEVLMHDHYSCFWFNKKNGKTKEVFNRGGDKMHLITCLDTPVSIRAYRRRRGKCDYLCRYLFIFTLLLSVYLYWIL